MGTAHHCFDVGALVIDQKAQISKLTEVAEKDNEEGLEPRDTKSIEMLDRNPRAELVQE